jgi:hypothetical protein
MYNVIFICSFVDGPSVSVLGMETNSVYVKVDRPLLKHSAAALECPPFMELGIISLLICLKLHAYHLNSRDVEWRRHC